ncbi:serine/threonine-protein kinase [Nocardiopsis suaedae]|uniref:Serine/threonine-protein kinase n=1 Tax=Nocardiopsis suaedae TaxID=3018444 RepID=A0ABT4TLI0_9ACTN|nr:serine/threonine-protein kinase [Nocardiopsis suaedae]MDA2805250.1 serine/threonine-protein kinase [Nocardiopsis suaedae]
MTGPPTVSPHRVGPYRLLSRLGGGGMGEVFLGRSPGGRPVAVKVVRAELAADPRFRKRFTAEVEAARKVGGFYTAQLVDSDTAAERPWLATAYIPGPSLHEVLQTRTALPVASVAVLGAGLAEGLAAIHRCGLVHRDLKPANVILADDGPRVIDFGIARALDATSTSMTRTVIGTPGFLSPEQARGKEVGPRSDVFALGCLLALASSGDPPFGTGATEAVVYRVVHEEPDLEGVPSRLAPLVRRCLSKKADDRPDLEKLVSRLNGLAGQEGRTEAEGWLPDDVTEVIRARTTRVAAPVPEDPPKKTKKDGGDGGKSGAKDGLREGKGAAAAKKPVKKPAPKPSSGKPSASASDKARPAPPPKKPAGPGQKPGTGGSKPPDGKKDEAKGDDSTGFWLGMAAVALGVAYVAVAPVSLVMSSVLNGGTDNVAIGDCMAYVSDDDGGEWVEVPCFAAAATTTVAWKYTQSSPSDPSDYSPTPAACGAASFFPVVNGETVCLAPNDD